ncbi:MAG: Chaperone protein HtpG [uncultured Thiotrichaceae bacterium]|uniref:Chaperone protein HtpG n=1 Tax=uncultured Thiotrichaceae bacterium TaxID=298394 RepID=A0A6S6TWR7_9GAMM|nr:MAG: Chaperone protein HtpG [uncultured Thiotrichaceae bacterium]
MSGKENMQFQTEVDQLLQLMIHSLYSNKEIFLRELVSNSADACDKLRFEGVKDDSLYESDPELRIEIEADSEANTITIRDNGIGMNRDEVITNIGTIAKSGTKEFLQKLSTDQSKDANLIGQFGVGFYSSFIVADKVTLKTRRAGDDAANGTVWESDGTSGYSLETIEKEARGTEIILHLKDDEKELANEFSLRGIVSKYSEHIPIIIKMRKQDDEGKVSDEWEAINAATALWKRPKSEVKDEEYAEFYKTIAMDWQEPLSWSHNHVEGKYEYTSLLYIPSKAPFDLWEQQQKHGIKLYVQRVFILDDTENLMPRYLRFVRGLIDSNDLPLNVSREILQSNRVIESMKNAAVKKVLGLLKSMAKNDKEKYQTFWTEFGNVIKEGPGEDFSNKEEIAKLLRFSSTATDTQEQDVSLEDYIARMKADQEKIYFITADSFAAAKNSPHLEVFRKKDIEVLLLSDRVDEWLVSHLTEFDGKSMQSVAKGELDLDKFDSEDDKKAQEKIEKEAQDVIERLKASLGDKVEDVRVSHRLTSSPSCIVLSEHDMALYMQQLMKQAGQEMPNSKPVLEINPTHPMVAKISEEKDEALFGNWSSILFDQAVLAEGGQLEDPTGFVSKLNAMMF